LKIAIMQPYFVPYAGYFRLLAAADLFIAYDCVQFPRRGWVHRNRLCDANGALQWLTLPLRKGDRDTTRICDLAFPDDAAAGFAEQGRRFPALKRLDERYPALARRVIAPAGDPVGFLVETLAEISDLLGFGRPIVRSSTLDIAPELKAQDRIIAIARRMGATSYINAPGGRELYDAAAFRQAGMSLHFLSTYEGGHASILERLANDDLADIKAEIQRNLVLDPPL
jgi:hypothetical protein